MIGQRRIDERFLTVERLRGATARQPISVKVSLSRFGEEFGNRPQPELVPPVPPVQRLSEDCSGRHDHDRELHASAAVERRCLR